MKNTFSSIYTGGGVFSKRNLLKSLSISFLEILLVFAGCTNAAGGSSGGGYKPSGGDSDDPRNVVVGTYNNVVIDGIEYTPTFYEGGFGFIKKASSGNMRAIMPDVPAEGSYFTWTLSGDTVIMLPLTDSWLDSSTLDYSGLDSFTLDFSNSGGTKRLSNLQAVPAATYEWNEATKTLTFKGPGEINHRWYSNLDQNEIQELENKVEKIVIQDGVTIIGYGAASMENLKSVTIPNSVAVIWSGAFFGTMSSLTSLTLPDNTDVFGGAFLDCAELTDIIVGSNHKYFTAENGILYNKDKTRLIAWPAASGTVSIPSTVAYINFAAFLGSMSLTSVEIPSSVTEILPYTFGACGLQSVTIPNSVTSIGHCAFRGCSELTSVVIPDSVGEIGDLAFDACRNLAIITVEATTPPKLGTYAFKGNRVERKIYVPSASVSAYKAAAGWSEYADIIEPIPAS